MLAYSYACQLTLTMVNYSWKSIVNVARWRIVLRHCRQGTKNMKPLSVALLAFFLITAASLFSAEAFGQGETTSAIVGQVTDATHAAVRALMSPSQIAKLARTRTATTDGAGRFNFPQLKPGAYSVRVEAEGFEPQQNDKVFSGLGQKQTVDFELKVARSKQTIEVSGEAPLINPENANTSTTLSAPALENLPNPGGDLTYPLQFSPGALINTAGAATISWAARMDTATSNSTVCLPCRTATSSMDWKPTTL